MAAVRPSQTQPELGSAHAQEAPSIGDLMRTEALTAAGSDALPLLGNSLGQLGHSLGQQPSGNPFNYDTFKGFELPKASSAAAAALHEAVGLLASQKSAEKRTPPQGAHVLPKLVHVPCEGLLVLALRWSLVPIPKQLFDLLPR